MAIDQLELNLMDAFCRVRRALADDPARRGRRLERAARATLRRPVRAWCVGLRASDTRWGRDDFLDEADARAERKGYPHRLAVRGSRVAALCAPVRLGYPGRPVREAAALLGRPERAVYAWAARGALRSFTEREPGRRGKPTRWVWSPTALDPLGDDGRPPWSVWGGAWMGMGGRVPGAASWVLERRPRMRRGVRHGGDHSAAWPGLFVGWDWSCPGRVLADGRLQRCGRACKKLWLPLPVWTVGAYLSGRGDAREEAVWDEEPWWDDSGCRPACARCWGLRFDNPRSVPAEAWNRFVTVISGGLLYGREVERVPADGAVG
jgi:hypothetical protein